MATTTTNGAISRSTSGSAAVNYFSKVGTYAGRNKDEVAADMLQLFAEDPEKAIKLIFATRLISRKASGGEDVSTGFGRRDEFYKAIEWLAENQPEVLKANLHLIPTFGSWKDFFNEPLLNLPTEWTFPLFKKAWNEKDQLFLKFLPQIRSKGKIRSPRDKARSTLAVKFCEWMKMSPVVYRKEKAKGQAHIWQKQMSSGDWSAINFNGVPGKAMFLHISQTGKDEKTVFERHGLSDDLLKWATETDRVKFTGYPYELLKAAGSNPSAFQKEILNRQFLSVLEPMKNHSLGNVLACLDTSGSMGATVGNTSALNICLSMGLVFANLNVGTFHKKVCMFDDVSSIHQLHGADFVSQVEEINEIETAWGSTNFQSVIDALVAMRTNDPSIPLDQYPETLLVISDMQFNPGDKKNIDTNHQLAMKKLRDVGLGEVRIIWWWVNGAGKDFPVAWADKGTYCIGGFDPTNLKSLMGLKTSSSAVGSSTEKISTPMDGLNNFLLQPIFESIIVCPSSS